MNKLVRSAVVLSFIFLGRVSIAQDVKPAPAYLSMMDDYSYNFYEVVKAAEAYFEEHGRVKGSGFKPYERWKNENESKYAPSGRRDNVDHYLPTKEYQRLAVANDLKTKTSFPNGWVELGPWDANNVTSHYSPGIGRVEALWVDPLDDQKLFLGSRSGGFWKTTDGGSTWKNTTDFLVASGVRAIGVNPNNKQEVLINVQHGGNGFTYGIWRSTDAGETWARSAFNPDNLNWGGLGDNERIYEIAYDPAVANKIFVATTRGLYVSTDNLASWTRSTTANTVDVDFHPTDTAQIYAYVNSGTLRNRLSSSTDGGYSFSLQGTFSDNGNRQIYLSVSPSAPDHLYAGSTNGVYKSTDRGVSFTKQSNPDEAGLAFSVSDIDTNIMVYGYVDLHSSTDNGKTFTQRTRWSVQDDAYIHADLRTSECVNGVFYVGTDGYLAKSEDNGVTWTNLNDGTAIREFYAVGSSQGDYDAHMAGSQDNGTSILNTEGWVEWNGGDGMEALVHPLNSDWMIGSWQYGSRNYTRDGGYDGRRGTGNPDRGSGNAAWEAPFLLNAMNQMQVIHISDSLYTGDRWGLDWKYLGSPNIGLIGEADISPVDSNVIAVSAGSNLQITTDGGQTWSLRRIGLPNYTITDIAFHPTNRDVLVLTYNRYQRDNRKVYLSQDLGQTWQNITYDLGDMPLRTVTIDHSDSNYIYVGGEIGIYYKSMKGTEWTMYTDGLPNVTVKDLEIHYGSNTLRAATWGRGLWENTLIGRNKYPSIKYVKNSDIPTESTPKRSVDQYITADIDYDGVLKEVKVRWSVNDISITNEIVMENTSGSIWQSKTGIPSATEGDMIYFKVVAEGAQNDISETYTFHYETKSFEYCTGGGTPGTGSDYITRVKLNGVENSSGKEAYSDFTSTVIDLQEGETYELEVQLLAHFDLDTAAAWIDYDYNKDFTENERIRLSDFDNQNIAKGTFTVPTNADTVNRLRLRVRNSFGTGGPNACGDVAGEVEDYSIEIASDGKVSVREVATIRASISPVPNNGRFTIALESSAQQISIEIVDITGKRVWTQRYGNAQTIDVATELAAGTYTVKLTTENGVSIQKIVVQ